MFVGSRTPQNIQSTTLVAARGLGPGSGPGVRLRRCGPECGAEMRDTPVSGFTFNSFSFRIQRFQHCIKSHPKCRCYRHATNPVGSLPPAPKQRRDERGQVGRTLPPGVIGAGPQLVLATRHPGSAGVYIVLCRYNNAHAARVYPQHPRRDARRWERWCTEMHTYQARRPARHRTRSRVIGAHSGTSGNV